MLDSMIINHDNYSDRYIREILRSVRNIAMVGASINWKRPSNFVMKYLIQKGYRVIPVNKNVAGEQIYNEPVYPNLSAVKETVDMVDMFRPAKEAPQLVEDAIKLGAKVFWMQFELRNDKAASPEKAQKPALGCLVAFSIHSEASSFCSKLIRVAPFICSNTQSRGSLGLRRIASFII